METVSNLGNEFSWYIRNLSRFFSQQDYTPCKLIFWPVLVIRQTCLFDKGYEERRLQPSRTLHPIHLFVVYLTTLFLAHTFHRSIDGDGSCGSLSGVHLEGLKLLNIINPDSRCHIQDSRWELPEFRSGTLHLQLIWTTCCVVYWYLCFSRTLCLHHQDRRDRPIILKMEAAC